MCCLLTGNERTGIYLESLICDSVFVLAKENEIIRSLKDICWTDFYLESIVSDAILKCVKEAERICRLKNTYGMRFWWKGVIYDVTFRYMKNTQHMCSCANPLNDVLLRRRDLQRHVWLWQIHEHLGNVLVIWGWSVCWVASFITKWCVTVNKTHEYYSWKQTLDQDIPMIYSSHLVDYYTKSKETAYFRFSLQHLKNASLVIFLFDLTDEHVLRLTVL